MINKGDKITVLDEAIDGIVNDIKGSTVYITTHDGFDLQFEKSEVIKIGNELKNAAHHNISKAMQEKSEPIIRSFIKQKKADSKEESFDLHIEKLVRTTKGMQAFEMLELQIERSEER